MKRHRLLVAIASAAAVVAMLVPTAASAQHAAITPAVNPAPAALLNSRPLGDGCWLNENYPGFGRAMGFCIAGQTSKTWYQAWVLYRSVWGVRLYAFGQRYTVSRVGYSYSITPPIGGVPLMMGLSRG